MLKDYQIPSFIILVMREEVYGRGLTLIENAIPLNLSPNSVNLLNLPRNIFSVHMYNKLYEYFLQNL